VLEQQPAARVQIFRRSAGYAAKVRESVRTGGKRRARLEPQVALSQMWVVCGNIRRVRYDQAKACRDLLHNAGFAELVFRADIAGLPRIAGGRLLTPDSPSR